MNVAQQRKHSASRSNDIRLLQKVSAASQNATRPPAGPSKHDGPAKSQEVFVESRGDWGTFFDAAKKLSHPAYGRHLRKAREKRLFAKPSKHHAARLLEARL
ncbi:MAG: hypothetical protein AB1547_03725 [Thermodesulfobacteriota bacterium]